MSTVVTTPGPITPLVPAVPRLEAPPPALPASHGAINRLAPAGATVPSATVPSTIAPPSRLSDYLVLVRPRIAAMVLVTVSASMFLAGWGPPPLLLLWQTVAATALLAASSGALNQWLERSADALMPRTADRPLPTGRLSSAEALSFTAITLVAGLVWLSLTAGPLAAALGGLTWLIYVAAYTPLKRTSPLNTAVGAVAGALPMLIGWAAAGGAWTLGAATLFALVYLWQFPHFMAIAWIYRHEYRRAGMAMLTVVDPSGRRAARQAIVAAAALWAVSLVPAMLWCPPERAPLYLALATLLGLWQLFTAVRFARRLDDGSARSLLRMSLVYLPVLLLLIVVIPLI